MLVALFLAAVAAGAGFVVGRETADSEPAAAETTEATTTEAETAGTTTTTNETQTEAEGTTTAETGDEGEDEEGAAVFAEAGCGGCHRFAPADSNGTVGPPLDGIDMSKDAIEQQVRNGGAGMPAFGDRLSDAEIEAVADFVQSG